MEKKVYKIGYEDTDKKLEVEIYGEKYEIRNISNDRKKEYENLDKSNKNDIEKELEILLGNGSIEKINNKRKSDGYKELTIENELGLIGFIFSVFADSMVNNAFDPVINTMENAENKINNMINQRRRKPYNRNRNYRRNYRR